jgi:hypothetical protein
LRGCIESNLSVANHNHVGDPETLKSVVHTRAQFMTANAGQAYLSGHKIRPPQAGDVASFIDSFANRGRRAYNADSERVGRPGDALAENVQIEIKNDGLSFRSAAIHPDGGPPRCRITRSQKTRRFSF